MSHARQMERPPRRPSIRPMARGIYRPSLSDEERGSRGEIYLRGPAHRPRVAPSVWERRL